MTYMVLEIQELSGIPAVIQQPMTDPSDIKEAKSIALQKAGYWTNPPAGVTPPPVVTIMAMTVDGRPIPGYVWSFKAPIVISEPEPEEPIPQEEN